MLVDYKYYIEDFGGEKISTESAFKKTRDLAEMSTASNRVFVRCAMSSII